MAVRRTVNVLLSPAFEIDSNVIRGDDLIKLKTDVN